MAGNHHPKSLLSTHVWKKTTSRLKVRLTGENPNIELNLLN